MMAELGEDVSCVGVAKQYQGMLDVFLIDREDEGHAPEIERLGIQPQTAPIMMYDEADKVELARYVLALADG
jgi:hypothetical protein